VIYPTEGSLEKYQLPPFEAAIKAGATSVMTYYNVPDSSRSADQLPKSLWYSPPSSSRMFPGPTASSSSRDCFATSWVSRAT